MGFSKAAAQCCLQHKQAKLNAKPKKKAGAEGKKSQQNISSTKR